MVVAWSTLKPEKTPNPKPSTLGGLNPETWSQSSVPLLTSSSARSRDDGGGTCCWSSYRGAPNYCVLHPESSMVQEGKLRPW